MKSWPNVKLGQVPVSSNIAQNHSSSTSIGSHIWSLFAPIHEKLTKSEIRSSSSHLAYRKSYLVIIWPKVKLGQVQVSSNRYRKSYLVIICPKSHEKLTKREIRSSSSRFEHCSESLIGSHIWSLFAPIYIKSWAKLKFWLYLGLITIIWAYLPLIALILPYICAIFTLYIHSSIETVPLCKIVEQSDHYSTWRYCISKIWGIQLSSDIFLCSFRYFTSA